MKGWPQSSQVHTCRFEALKRTLEILGSRQLQKRGDFVITESQNRLTQREKSLDFLRCVSPCPSFAAGGFLEFLRSVTAHQNGMCAVGRIAAIPSFRVPLRTYSFVPPLPTYDDLLKGEFWKFDDCFSSLFFCFQNPGFWINHFDLSNRLRDLKSTSA